ncbi:putative leucine-rich repeat receptor-like serine/threonine-protein kinase At2g19230 [Eucalyptus grandis]|uniref:putative leucine-rich repeat receptor-like serine/threonine-protein kinase At2g19230 n=1 Tax=Eucalyptus grandis TaxID=71139 RepID=UPI00192E8955|nr:putative leucine-rich repeat receptor-like serine/threonine-protein kinase At2g19230 [Eucalyptus grandis]
MDDEFIGSGESMPISQEYQREPRYLNDVRIFPHGTRNCYTLRPDQGKNRTYLIKAYFWYGNYDGMNQPPHFDLYIDANFWTTVGYDIIVEGLEQIVYVSKTDDIQVCLVNTKRGVPYISLLELSALDDDIYPLESGFLLCRWRFNLGISGIYEFSYPEDVYDRTWSPKHFSDWSKLNTTVAIDLSKNNNAYKVPGEVLRTAETTMSSSSPLYLEWTTSALPNTTAGSLQSARPMKWIVNLHFMEIERLIGRQREFTISLNDNQFTATVSLEYLKPVVVVSTPVTGSLITLLINSTNNYGNPPILNAMEFFNVVDSPNVPTAQDDVKAINIIKAIYQIKRESWQGDPCVPTEYTWEGLNCSHGNPPRITSLNLSSSNLMGNITSAFSNISAMENLDLSNNQLTGAIPENLAELLKLRLLNLSGNNLIESVPEALNKRVRDKTLYMSLTGKAELCSADPCPHKKTQNTILVPVVTSVLGFFVVLFGALAIIWLVKWKQIAEYGESTLRLKNRPFKYEEVSKITGNFGRVIGEGGFGKVYLGELDNGNVVAVKMLSKLSKQGYKEFQAEAQLLAIVHHRNLVSLFGYCNDSKHMALIYEYMANGNLRQHLSEDYPKVLTWSKRLQIAVDAAQGLDYLHNGCKPPIIHRDMKSSNILLNEDFGAKIADFGLSRAYAAENDTHVSTHPAGTFGYLSPEFQTFGNCDKKSDVYSFGIVLFELITGQPAIKRSWDGNDVMHILEWLIPIVESGDIQRIMDPRLRGEFNTNSAWKVVEIAMSCTQRKAIERPDINHVLAELKESLVSNSSSSFEVTFSEINCDSVPMAR